MAEVKKSVSFNPDTEVLDGASQPLNGDDKSTAENHTADPVDEVTVCHALHPSFACLLIEVSQDLFKDLAKKKKKKPKKEEEDGADVEKADDADELDMLALKKKKKKKPKADDFEAKLAEVGGDVATDKPAETPVVVEGDMEKGTGIWAHESTDSIPYELLLKRFFIGLHDRHPDLSGMGSKSTKIPPPQCLREGNKKTIFANLSDIAKRLKRNEDHVTQFLFAELGTNGSVDASRRLVIKGRFQSKQIEK
jgi:translation initiation factor 2 subunit 2